MLILYFYLLYSLLVLPINNLNNKSFCLFNSLSISFMFLDFNYSDLKKKHDIYEKEKSQKLTWDQLENLNFNHFVTNREDDFKPEDILDIDYDLDEVKQFLEMKHQIELK